MDKKSIRNYCFVGINVGIILLLVLICIHIVSERENICHNQNITTFECCMGYNTDFGLYKGINYTRLELAKEGDTEAIEWYRGCDEYMRYRR